MNIRYKLNDQHLLYHVSCMRQNCCNAICFSRCPKELFLSRVRLRKAVKNWASVSWLFMWWILLISSFTDPNYFAAAPYNQTCPWVSSWPFVTKQFQVSWLVVPQCMCLDVFLHSLMCSDVFSHCPMCSDVFSHSPMCSNWWRRLLTAHTASQSQSSHKPHSRRDSKPIFTQNPKSKSHFFWNKRCASSIFSSFSTKYHKKFPANRVTMNTSVINQVRHVMNIVNKCKLMRQLKCFLQIDISGVK